MYQIHLICYHWSCGDGCCSDSGYKYKIKDSDGKLLYEYDDWERMYFEESAKKSAISNLEEIVGRKVVENEDYVISDFREDSDNSDGEDSYY